MKQIILFDKWLFLKLNAEYRNALFDWIMPFIRNPYFWAPLYIFILALVWLNCGKKGTWWIIYVFITAGLTDLLSSQLIKPMVGRIRPCNDPELMGKVNLLVSYCGANGSFTSSHAANHFGMATFIFFTASCLVGAYRWLFFIWAAIICYAQIYVGVHFPLDILGGTIIGYTVGKITAKIFTKYFGPLSLLS
ncbi:MAG TPA: phosphatase PAP2 family protein [Ferruginibacter sp.]|nr:phosphatase PAP2 family protein [Bacteroidota bacterium]MCC6692066.1 phosphatase PAP2 family protein [Chitinophagaceae bacterium]HMT95397.1 phosphatase PAP2 family protein [Ferruginibacter sp.]HMU23762.1 phosphatase PAP2 family protein [Ferruginibacter sp.]